MQDEGISDLSKVCSRLGDGAGQLVRLARLVDLDGYWLELHCCANIRLTPLRMLARQKGGQHQLDAVLSRLRCKTCGAPPARVWLNETPHRTFNHGPPPGWSVQLIPAPAMAQRA